MARGGPRRADAPAPVSVHRASGRAPLFRPGRLHGCRSGTSGQRRTSAAPAGGRRRGRARAAGAWERGCGSFRERGAGVPAEPAGRDGTGPGGRTPGPGRGAPRRSPGRGDGFAHAHPYVFSQLPGPHHPAPKWPAKPLATWEIRAADASRTLRGWAMSARPTSLRGPGSETLRDRMLRAKLPCRHSAGSGTCHSGTAGRSRFDHEYRRTGSRAKPRGNVQERQDLGDANTEGGLAS